MIPSIADAKPPMNVILEPWSNVSPLYPIISHHFIISHHIPINWVYHPCYIQLIPINPNIPYTHHSCPNDGKFKYTINIITL